MPVVELGNSFPVRVADDGAIEPSVSHGDPCVTYVNLAHTNDHDNAVDVVALRAHLWSRTGGGGVTNFGPGAESLTELFHPTNGLWAAHSAFPPTWVACDDDPALAGVVGAWHNIPVGRPADVEQTHYTTMGAPGSTTFPGPWALVVNTGNDILSKQIGGGGIYTPARTSTGTGATSLTDTGAAFSTSLVGQVVVCGTVYGVIESATGTILTIDRWYNPNTPGGAAGATPGATTAYMVVAGTAPAVFLALSTTNTASVTTDTTMAGEITTASGGLIRALATFAHTASATTYTLTNTFTANGSDVLPATVYRDGAFISLVTGWANSMLAETLLNASATLNVSGDAVTVTHTFTV